MQILFISPSLTRRGGGIFEITRNLAFHLNAIRGVSVDAVGLEESGDLRDLESWVPTHVKTFAFVGPRALGFSPRLCAYLERSEHDLAHLHSLWMHTSAATRAWARRHRKAYVVSPNGMLEPWALRNSRWKKRLASFVYEDRMLRGASCLLANTRKELEDIRAFGLRNPVAIIPNGVTLPPDLTTRPRKEDGGMDDDKRRLLFLGRIHPKKGVAELLDAWRLSNARRNGWVLDIAGWDDCGGEPALRACATRWNLDESVTWLGPVFGKFKDRAFRRASAFILPSRSEGVPIAILEAWSYGLPVLKTSHCNLQEGFDAQAAIRIDCSPESISEALDRLAEIADGELQEIGRRGRRLVETKFAWNRIAASTKAVYDWILGRESRPASVNVA